MRTFDLISPLDLLVDSAITFVPLTVTLVALDVVVPTTVNLPQLVCSVNSSFVLALLVALTGASHHPVDLDPATSFPVASLMYDPQASNTPRTFVLSRMDLNVEWTIWPRPLINSAHFPTAAPAVSGIKANQSCCPLRLFVFASWRFFLNLVEIQAFSPKMP
jgi:hypothetical protein